MAYIVTTYNNKTNEIIEQWSFDTHEDMEYYCDALDENPDLHVLFYYDVEVKQSKD